MIYFKIKFDTNYHYNIQTSQVLWGLHALYICSGCLTIKNKYSRSSRGGGDPKIKLSPNNCKNDFSSIYKSFIDILFNFVLNNYPTPGNPVFSIKNDEKPIKENFRIHQLQKS